MSECNTEVILMKDGFILTRCEHCDRICLMYQQFMIRLNSQDFGAFMRYIEHMEFESHYFPFYDGIDRIVLETYHPDIQFTLMEEEFYMLKAYLQEAKMHLQIAELLKQ
ncbi:DUF6686 family protein [Belliella marina]|uniref:DUF6686 family protein n=1 Tax=Belliella marina TaxID=1644146 RepID=A0ABW4VQH2_9BACT